MADTQNLVTTLKTVINDSHNSICSIDK